MNINKSLKHALRWSLAPAIILIVGSLFFIVSGRQKTPDEVLAILTKGNQRFATDQPSYPQVGPTRRAEVAGGQQPLATIISCSDSRVPPEILFDAGIGDLFIVRVIGNISSGDEVGSAEYGVEHLNTALMVVLGHTSCGAVTAAVNNDDVHGNIPPVLANIRPAVLSASLAHPELKGSELIPEAIKANVFHSMEQLLKRSESIRNKALEGKVKVVGAVYDIKSGQIEWLGGHPQQDQLLTYKEAPPVKEAAPARRSVRRKG